MSPHKLSISYIDPQLSQSDANRLYYGANYARLQSIKKT